jgi:hypothetical protein
MKIVDMRSRKRGVIVEVRDLCAIVSVEPKGDA